MKIGLVRAGLMIGAVAGMAIGNVAVADDYTPPKVYTLTPTGVNLSDGSYTFTETDLAIGPLTLERFYISGLRDPNTKFFGPRVTSNFDIYVSRNLRPAINPFILPARYAPIVHLGNGTAGVYAQAGTTSPVYTGNPDAYSNDLSLVSGHYVFTSNDGTIYTFGGPAVAGNASAERVTGIAFTDGRTQTFSYNGSNQLKMVADSSGYALIFDYNGSGLTSAACAFNLSQTYVTASSTCSGAALVVSYGYTSGLLTSVTGVDGQVTTYTRYGNEISCIKPPGYTTCKVSTTFVSGQPYTVSQQTLADGSVWNYTASGNASASRVPDAVYTDDPTAYTAVTDPNGKTSYYYFSKSSPYSMVDANGRTTSYRYTGGYEYEWGMYGESIPPERPEGTMLVEADLPEGNKYLAEYNGPYNAISKQTFVPKSGSGLANAVIQYGYSCSAVGPTCTKPIWKKDPKNNQSDFAYTVFGAIQSEMLPAPTTGAARPLKLYTYVQKYAYLKNSSGTLVASSTPVWLPDTTTECQTAAGSSTAACDSAAPIRVTSYQYGANGAANNLLVRGMAVTAAVAGTPTTLRTCFGYDARGRKISTTTPRAALSVCP